MQNQFKPNTKSILILAVVIASFTIVAIPLTSELTAINMLALYTLSFLSIAFYMLQNRTFLTIHNDQIAVRQNCLQSLKSYQLDEILDVVLSEKLVEIHSEKRKTALVLEEFSAQDRATIRHFFQKWKEQNQPQQQQIAA